MRKYQQLLLLLISCFSVGVLLMYKSENNRLKYVLQVVNFFGRSDAAVANHITNTTIVEYADQLELPLPVWQVISSSFHVYSIYWNRNELVAGGEVIAVVVGKLGAVVNFRCSLSYDGGIRSIQGKFRFQRLDNVEYSSKDSDFTSYIFFCRLTRDFGEPEGVIFTDTTVATPDFHKLRLRNISKKNSDSSILLSTICLNLVDFNMSSIFAQNEKNMLQFFYHHQSIGVDDFLVYNGDELPYRVRMMMHQFNIRLHLLPFNFPFRKSHVPTDRFRRIIEMDCLLRNINQARYTLLLDPNEFFYPNAKLDGNQSVLRSIHHYAAEITHFELPTYAVCTDSGHKLLMDNTFYDSDVNQPHSIFVYRPHVPVSSEHVASHSVVLPLAMTLVNRYINCLHIGKDGLHDWRNSLRDDFMNYLQTVRNHLIALI